METKLTLVCTKCTVEKLTEEFHKRKDSKTGFRSECKSCNKNFNKKYYEKNKELLYEYRKDNKEHIAKYREENKERLYEASKKYREENKEKRAKSIKKWREENKGYDKKYYEENKERLSEASKKYREENKERVAESIKKWREENPHKRRVHSSRRRAKKIQATPTWTSQFQKLQIDSLCDEAVNLELTTGVKFHLDHVHPLTSKYICGLHLPCNLQLLTGSENCSKHNKFQPFVESELDPENLKPWECFYPILSIDISESTQSYSYK